MWISYLAASSVGRRTVRPVSAVLTAFRDDLALPSVVCGPVLSWEFARFAASWAADVDGGAGVETGDSAILEEAASSVAKTKPFTALRSCLRALRSAESFSRVFGSL